MSRPRAAFEISGSSAIVTAGGSGIGRQIVEDLTQAGIDTVVNDIDEDALSNVVEDLQDTPGMVRTVQGDVADESAMRTLIQTAVDEFGGIDILVNNVGIAGPTKPCEEISTEEFMRTLQVNVGGAFNVTSEAIPSLRESEAGRVINIASMSGKRPLRDRTPYTTSKMGIIGFTRTLAVELAEDDVTVNAICPGSVEGPRLDAVIEGQAKSQNRPVAEVEAELLSDTPLNRFIEPADIAGMVLYLCSDRAAKVTGQDLNVTAGACMH